MQAYENDILIIPDKYKKMSVSELEREEKRLLEKSLASKRTKKVVKTKNNINNISFKF
jgi:hypothetical protein